MPKLTDAYILSHDERGLTLSQDYGDPAGAKNIYIEQYKQGPNNRYRLIIKNKQSGVIEATYELVAKIPPDTGA